MDQLPPESSMSEGQHNGMTSQPNAQLGMAPVSQVGSQGSQALNVSNVQLVSQQPLQHQNVPIQNLHILPNARVQAGTANQVQQFASAGTVQQANVRQLLARSSGQPIRLQQVAGGSNVIRLVNQGSQPTGQIMIQSAAGAGNVRLAQMPQNQTFRLVNANQQPRQTFVLSQPVTQTTQAGVVQSNMGQIRIVNLGGNQLASLAGLQVRQPVQGQMRLAYAPSTVNAQLPSTVSSSVAPVLAQTATGVQQTVNIQANSVQQPVNIQIANNPQNSAQVRLQSAQTSNVQLQNQQQLGLQTSTQTVIQQPVSVQQTTQQATQSHQLIAQKTQIQNQLTIQQPQSNQTVNPIQIAAAQTNAQKPQQIVVNAGQLNQQMLLQQLANQQLQQRNPGQAFVKLKTAQPTSQTHQVVQSQTHANQNALQVSSAEIGNHQVGQQLTVNIQQPQSDTQTASQTKQTTQISSTPTMIHQSPQPTTSSNIQIQITPPNTVYQPLGQPQTKVTLPTSIPQTTTEPLRIAPLPIVSNQNSLGQPTQSTLVTGQTTNLVQTIVPSQAESNPTISVKTISHPVTQVVSGQLQENKAKLISKSEVGSAAPAKIVQKAALPAGVKLLKNPLQNIDIPAQIQKMQVALEHIMKIANTPENQPKIQDIQRKIQALRNYHQQQVRLQQQKQTTAADSTELSALQVTVSNTQTPVTTAAVTSTVQTSQVNAGSLQLNVVSSGSSVAQSNPGKVTTIAGKDAKSLAAALQTATGKSIILPQGAQIRPGTTLVIRSPNSGTQQTVVVGAQGGVRLAGAQPQQVRLQGGQVSLIRAATPSAASSSQQNMQVVRILKPSGNDDGGKVQKLLKPKTILKPLVDGLDGESTNDSFVDDRSDCSTPDQAQAKADRIIQEAIKKANKEGRLVPKVIHVPGNEKSMFGGKQKREGVKKEVKPKGSKDKKAKEPKEKTPRQVKIKSSKKKKIPAFLKRKRKRNKSSDDEPAMSTPPASEDDDDSSFMEKRRSTRHSKRKRYKDDIDLGLSDRSDDSDTNDAPPQPALFNPDKANVVYADNPPETESQIVDKVLGKRMRKQAKAAKIEEQVQSIQMSAEGMDVDVDVMDDDKPWKSEASQDDSPKKGEVPGSPLKSPRIKFDPNVEYEDVEEFYVKYKNYSYLHCDWKTEAELERGDKRIGMKIRNYRRKQASINFSEVDDGEYFNPDYVEAERILDVSVVPDPDGEEEELTYYLVKWRGLPYEDSTWELSPDVDKDRVEEFMRWRDPPDEDERLIFERPTAREWASLDESPVYKNNNTIRSYQLEGINWLTFCYYNKQNCILADEMGLGKTIQSITFLMEIYNYGIKGPFLVIVPLSTIGNWQREFELWTDINVVVYHGAQPSRNMIQQFEMYYRDEKGRILPGIYKFHAMVTTFETIISDCEVLSQIDWRICIIDEAHRLKNQKCKLIEGLRIFELEHKVLLTGTPLQNNVEELFSLLNFLEPRQFNSQEDFMEDFGQLESESQVLRLKAILKPMMLRRLKEDVEKSIAPKEETIVEVELTNVQKKYYRAILERNFTYLSKGSTSSNVPNLMNTMMELRKCCNHPYLINGAEDKILEEAKAHHDELISLEKAANAMIQASGKLVLMDKLLPKLKAGGHKVLVFSQMIRVLDILEDYLISRLYPYERIDGRITGHLRQAAIDRFSKPESDRFVFLLCTRAGGLGINLTAADTVIIYDSDWNPQNDLQAQARCHRIGQQREVKVYRLITRNTYEREMFDKASLKLGLDKAVLQSMGPKEGGGNKQELSKKEVEDLLKRGAYGALMDDDREGDEFCEEDIDNILQKRTQVIRVEGGEKGSTFSKATFSTAATRSDIDVDDPQFWEKWARKADLDMDQLTKPKHLIMDLPRQRKQTTRYAVGNGGEMMDNMSELDSSGDSEFDDDGKKIKGKKGGKNLRKRKKEEKEGAEGPFDYYTRNDCFKVEKNLLHFGWGRWEEIMQRAKFKRKLVEHDVITLTRAILFFSLQNYAGDEQIKGFIYDLILPVEEGQEKAFKNHQGLSAPVPRGRKGKQAKIQSSSSQLDLQMAEKMDIDPDGLLSDDGYKKHLKRHANKILLRVRLLYYIRQEVIGEENEKKVFEGVSWRDIDIPRPYAEGSYEPPVFWWNEDADRCMLIGTFKHGYEKYALMRNDPALLYLDRCGPPDKNEVAREQNDDIDEEKLLMEGEEGDSQSGTPTSTPKRTRGRGGSRGSRGRGRGGRRGRGRGRGAAAAARAIDKTAPAVDDSMSLDEDDVEAAEQRLAAENKPKFLPPENYEEGSLPWPSASDLNVRLRRIITGYQRLNKREQQKQDKSNRKIERRERFEAVMKERERQRRDHQQRWSRREEADFYRVVSTFGVERDRYTGQFKWDTFRSLAKLYKKYDDTLFEYFKAFYYMLRRVLRLFTSEEDAIPPNSIFVEPITEERASRCMARIELLNKIRENVLWHEQLEERLKLCRQTNDMPDWWTPGEHDKELLIGAAKHGLARTDYHILYDPKLCFRDIANKFMAQVQKSGKPHDQSKAESVIDTDGNSSKENSPSKAPKSENSDVKTEDEIKVKDGEVKTEPEDKSQDEKMDGVKEHSELKIKIKKEGLNLSPVKHESKESPSKIPKPEVKPEDNVAVPEAESEQTVGGERTSSQDEEGEGRRSDLEEGEISRDDLDAYRRGPLRYSQDERVNTVLKQLYSGDDQPVPAIPEEEEGMDGEPGEQTEWPQAWLLNPALMWPKDRTIFHRLEKVSQCVEKGEWPSANRFAPRIIEHDSRSNTPVPGPSRSDYYLGPSDTSMSDGLRMIFKKKRGRKSKIELEAENYARLKELGVLLSDGNDSESGVNTPCDEDGSGAETTGEIGKLERMVNKRSLGDTGEHPAPPRRRAWSPSSLDPEARVPVICLEDGSARFGEEAPMAKDVNKWLEEHPGYSIARPDLTEEELGQMSELISSNISKRYKRGRLDPAKLEIDKLTGEENVWVVSRDTGKRITGAKAPPLKHLLQWLERNPGFDVDPKWAHIVQAKGNIPEDMQHRILQPREGGGRGRKPGSTNRPSPKALSEYYNQMSRLYGGKVPPPTNPGMPPFGNMQSLAAMNPLYAAQMAQLMMKGGEGEDKEEGEVVRDAKGMPTVVGAQAPALSHVYNQMMLNQMYAAQAMAAANLPQTLPSSLSHLMQAAQAQASMAKTERAKPESSTPKASRKNPMPTKVKDMIRQIDAEARASASASSSSSSHFQEAPQDLSVKPIKVSQLLAQAHKNAAASRAKIAAAVQKSPEAIVFDLSKKRAVDEDEDDEDEDVNEDSMDTTGDFNEDSMDVTGDFNEDSMTSITRDINEDSINEDEDTDSMSEEEDDDDDDEEEEEDYSETEDENLKGW